MKEITLTHPSPVPPEVLLRRITLLFDKEEGTIIFPPLAGGNTREGEG